MTKRDVLIIVFAGMIGLFILNISASRDDRIMLKYDGCYEEYAQNKIPAEAFEVFMRDCMNRAEVKATK